MCIWEHPAPLNTNTASMQKSNINSKCQNVSMQITQVIQNSCLQRAQLCGRPVCCMHHSAWRFILRFGKRFSAGIERKSHFKEFHCDYMNQRTACVTGETAGLDVRKCIKGSQRKNDSSNTGYSHTLTDPTNTKTSFKDTTNIHTSL